MTEYVQRIHRTWVQLLINHGYKDAASLALGIELSLWSYLNEAVETPERIEGDKKVKITLRVPFDTYKLLVDNERIQKLIERALISILKTQKLDFAYSDFGGTTYYHDFPTDADFDFEYGMSLLQVEEGWQEKAKFLIAQSVCQTKV